MADTLVDAGPLVAMFVRSDAYHTQCARIVRDLDCPFVTTLPVVMEAMHFLHAYMGLTGQDAVWRLILRGDLLLEHPTTGDLERMNELMTKYADLPMDFADASLVAVAERLSLNRIFTVDRDDFTNYRLHRTRRFTVIGPG